MDDLITDQVLIVDDDPMFRLMLEKFLHKEGFAVAQAASGEEALSLFAATPALIVLMDADMPGISGFECCERLRELPGGADVSVLMLTALDDEAFVDRAFAAGAMDYLTKPVRWAVLRNRLHYLSQLRRSQRAQRISEARKSAILASAQDCIVTVDLRGVVQEMNPAACRTFGFDIDTAFSGLPIAGLVPALQVLASDRPPAGLFDRLKESVALARDGREFPIEMSLSRTEAEGSGFYTLILRDIAARKQTERELQLAATVLESTAEAVMVTDADNYICSVNPSFCRITGFPEQEVIGQRPSMLKSGRHDEDFYNELWQALHNEGHWRGEIWNRRKNGDVYPQWLSINRVIGSGDDDVSCHVAMFSDISVRKKDEQRIWHQAHYDSLTQLPNRSYFRTCLEDAIRTIDQAGSKLALMFIDLDHFKAVNDSLGHSQGDQLLVDAAGRLRACVRADDVVARLGGDEFTAILPHIDSRAAAVAVGERILSAIIRPFELSGEQIAHISASIGITFYPEDATDLERLLSQADHAMYLSKQGGRNQLTLFEEQSATV